jgi:hypothetical protein
MVANRARNHHTPPRNPSGIRLENVAPDQDVTGRSRMRPSAPLVVDASSTSQGVDGGSGGGIGQATPAMSGSAPGRADTLGDPTHHLTGHHGQPFTGGTADRGRMGRAGLNSQGGNIGDLHPPAAPGPMSRQTT